MALRMARPIRSEKTGVWQLKVRVPADLKTVARGRKTDLPIGERWSTVTVGEFVEASLRTRDPDEAKARFAAAHATLCAFWTTLRTRPKALTHEEAVGLAGTVYRETVQQMSGEATTELFHAAAAMAPEMERARLDPAAADELAARLVHDHGPGLVVLLADGGPFGSLPGEDLVGRRTLLEQVYGPAADRALRRQGLIIDDASRALLLECIRGAVRDALAHSARKVGGDYRPDPNADRFPPPPTAEAPRTGDRKTTATISGLLAAYLQERQSGGTQGRAAEKRWTPVFRDFIAFLEHDDAARLRKADVIRWKDHRLQQGAAPKTVKDTEIAAFRTVFNWAVDNGRLPSNPAQGVKVMVPPKVRTREQGFTQSEAAAILTAASAYTKPPKEAPALADAKRWVPWLCAHTGARVAEICQLRKEDVRADGDVPFIRLTPAAGSIKNGQYRDVPLHPELIARGFLRFVAGSPEGPLFHRTAPRPDSKSTPADTVAKALAVWVRGLAVVDDAVSPNHGWRHRFKTVGQEAGVSARTLDAIQGHAPRTAGEGYGDVTLTTKFKAIGALPFILPGAADQAGPTAAAAKG